MKKLKKMSKRTTALLVAAALLLAAGTVTGTRAALNIRSDFYIAHFYLNHLQVHLIENGEDVCGGENDLDIDSKVTGRLATDLGYEDDDNLGSVEPGKAYREEIAAENGQDIDEFVRITVRKYWVAADKDGKPIKINGKYKKSTDLSPALIHLMYDGKDGYNTSAWTENADERTTESSTYYYKTDLDPEATSELLFDQIKIDGKVAEQGETVESKEGDKTVFTYTYKYDGYIFFVEADVQAIQTHNINDAIRSQWGVDNVKGSYDADAESGTLTVN